MNKKTKKKGKQISKKSECFCERFPDKKDCLEFINHSTIVIKDDQVKGKNVSKSQYKGINKSRKYFCKYHVDECILSQKQGKQCDFLLINNEEPICYFIELKGSDLIKAIEQLDKSIDDLYENVKDCKINARIVLTKVNAPDLRNTKYIRLQKKLKKYGGTLKQQSRILEENI